MSKPIIRHCRNCEYATKWTMYPHTECNVKFKTIWEYKQRITALFCRFYKPKGGAE